MSTPALASARSAVCLARALAPSGARARHAPETVLALTVDTGDILNVRRALVQSGAPHARIANCRCVPHTTRSRLLVACDSKWVGVVMRCVMRSVDAAEFGRCEALRH